MPPSPIVWLPSDHLLFFLLDLPNELDHLAIMALALAKDPRGEKGSRRPTSAWGLRWRWSCSNFCSSVVLPMPPSPWRGGLRAGRAGNDFRERVQ
jgi:hypothetical protein